MRWWTGAMGGAFVLALGMTACQEFHLSTSNLQIAPSPAVPGDMVQALLVVRLIPVQRHTIIFFIDDTEHLRVTRDGEPPIPVILELGDAANLIATYGTGEHTAFVQVRAEDENETARTRSVVFALNPSAR